MIGTTTSLDEAAKDYERIETAIRFLEENFRQQPSLEEVAAAIGLSEYHFHRLFSRWVGTTPKRFLQFLTAEYAKERLAESASVLDTAYDAGLSGGGRLHDLLVTLEAFSPGEYKKGGSGLVIAYGIHPSPFGACLLAVTERGVCGLEFLAGRTGKQTREDLAARWPGADLQEDPMRTAPYLARLFPPSDTEHGAPITLLVKGTNFQLSVWQALLRIPSGELVGYGDIARHLGKPGAARAVGSAVGSNPISYLIPCHRVIRAVADFGNYRWGAARKKAMIGWEAARREGLGA
jgi:AraC family transcriptional regulator of adaptative response/methylated-DNA-[protein]-cysteine methyltransferase